MIATLLESARRRAAAADLTYKNDETTTLELRGGRLASARVALSQGVSLRVQAGGRIGIAGANDGTPKGSCPGRWTPLRPARSATLSCLAS